MASIADLFARILLDDHGFEASVVKSATAAGDKAGTKAGATLGQRMAAALRKNFKGEDIGKGLVQGLGLAGGLGAARLFEVGVQRLGDVIGDATQAAIAEEASIQKLGTALRANVPAWDGQTAAIEQVLKARMDLGFSDDEQRDSLARIVVATKDVNKALAVQRVAMDLARLKGISLADASDALIKVEGGQFRALKALGIQLPKNAKATDALQAVEAAAAGQAEDYAKTNSGKLLVSQVEVDEAMEKFGAKTMPLVVGATVAGAEVVTDLVNVLDVLTDGLSDNTTEAQEQAGSIFDIVGALGAVIPGYTQLADAAKGAMETTALSTNRAADSADAFEHRAAESLGGVAGEYGTVEDASGDLAKAVKDDNKAVTTSWAALRKALADTVNQMITGVFEPIEAKNELAAANAEAAGARRIIASASATRAEKADAKDLLDSTVKDQASALVTLAEAGMANSATYKTGLKSLETYAKTTSGKTRRELDLVIAKIKEVEREGKSVPINVIVNRRGNLGASGARAEGGPWKKGAISWIGEEGPELMEAGGDAFVTPAALSKRLMDRVLATRDMAAGGAAASLQQFTTGGVVKGPPGSAQLAIVHAGEEVVTASERRTRQSDTFSRAIVHALTRSVSNIARSVSDSTVILRRIVETVATERDPAVPAVEPRAVSVSDVARQVSDTSIVLRKVVEQVVRERAVAPPAARTPSPGPIGASQVAPRPVAAGPTITVRKPGPPPRPQPGLPSLRTGPQGIQPLAPIPPRAVAQAVSARVKQMREAMLPGPWMPAAAVADVGGSLRPPAPSVPSIRPPSIVPAHVPSGLAAVGAGAPVVNNNATYNVPLLDRVEVRSVRDIGGSLRMLGEMGYLPHPGQRPPPGMPGRRKRS